MMIHTAPQINWTSAKKLSNGEFKDPSFAENKTLPVHRWANWIAGFSASFVQSCIDQYLPGAKKDSLILDPFAGVGTTLIEGFRRGANVIGFEINHYAALVAETKLKCINVDLNALREAVDNYESFMKPLEAAIDEREFSEKFGLLHSESDNLPTPETELPKGFRSKTPFFSPLVEKKVLFTLDYIKSLPEDLKSIFKVALGATMVSFSNYSYEPSLCSRSSAGKSLISNAPVFRIIGQKLKDIATDIAALKKEVYLLKKIPEGKVFRSSFFRADRIIPPDLVNLIVTSPPYMNNYHYIRNTRPHLYWLDFISKSGDLKKIEEDNFGKYWQTVRDKGTIFLDFDLQEANNLINQLRSIKTDKGIYGGPGWANYAAVYLNDTYKFCSLISRMLCHGGIAVIVVGNSIIQGIEVEVDRFFSILGEMHGLKTKGIHIIRGQRVGSSIVNTGLRESTKRKVPLYDAAVVLEK